VVLAARCGAVRAQRRANTELLAPKRRLRQTIGRAGCVRPSRHAVPGRSLRARGGVLRRGALVACAGCVEVASVDSAGAHGNKGACDVPTPRACGAFVVGGGARGRAGWDTVTGRRGRAGDRKGGGGGGGGGVARVAHGAQGGTVGGRPPACGRNRTWCCANPPRQLYGGIACARICTASLDLAGSPPLGPGSLSWAQSHAVPRVSQTRRVWPGTVTAASDCDGGDGGPWTSARPAALTWRTAAGGRHGFAVGV